MKIGDKVTATIRQIVEYGLWMQYQEDTAILVKIIDVSWDIFRLQDFSVGQECAVLLLGEVTDQSYISSSPLRRAGLPITKQWIGSLKDPEQDPWKEPLPIQVGGHYEGTITQVTLYGFFVVVGRPNLEGLVREADTAKKVGDRCIVTPREINVERKNIFLELLADLP